MKNKLTLLIGIALVLVLLAYMFTFQVAYDEVAVLTTFDRAKEPARDPETGQLLLNEAGRPVDPGSLKLDAGLYFKLPWPIQKVEKYPKKVQLLEDQLEEIQTKDGKAILVQKYLAWRITDPYAFFRTLQDIQHARQQLESLMSHLNGVITSYRFDELVNTDPQRMKLAQIEQACVEQLRERLWQIKPSYGIDVVEVGIRGILLPETTTQKVFDRMRATREAIAESIRAEGKAKASDIVSQARSAQQRILAFAQRRAEAIKDEGRTEAAAYMAAFREDQEFAIFLRQVEALKQVLPHNTTFILDANNLFLKPLEGSLTSPVATDRPGDEAVSARNQD